MLKKISVMFLAVLFSAVVAFAQVPATDTTQVRSLASGQK